MVELRIVPTRSSVADEAAEWFARQRSNRWTSTDAAAFTAWLKADETHTRAWVEYEQIWARVDAVRDDPRILELRESARSAGHKRVWFVVGAAAAAVLVAFGVWIAPMPTAFLPLSATPLTAKRPVESSAVRIASTQPGERSLLLLPDGSRITLNSASSVQTDYSQKQRRVILVRGQAFFEVAKDATRPFVVTAGSRNVVAVGTEFDVHLNEHQLRVTLVQGKVRVVAASQTRLGEKPPAEVSLTAGSAMTVLEGGSALIEPVDAQRAVHWRDDKLSYIIFDEERLSDVVTEMNRHSREQLVIADPSLEGRKVSGVFDSSAGRAVARALEAYGLVRADTSAPNVIMLRSP
jgi:transmembrane sensor